MLGTDERVSKFLGIIDEEMRDEIKEMLHQYPTSLTRWEAFVIFFKIQCQLVCTILNRFLNIFLMYYHCNFHNLNLGI